jgi:hypothetical protein
MLGQILRGFRDGIIARKRCSGAKPQHASGKNAGHLVQSFVGGRDDETRVRRNRLCVNSESAVEREI